MGRLGRALFHGRQRGVPHDHLMPLTNGLLLLQQYAEYANGG
jgi:hypothetical protein